MENDFCIQGISNSIKMRDFGYVVSLKKNCFQLFIVTQIPL